MRITRLYLRNYRVFEDALELEMPAGLVGVYGPNGAGKSTILESILWTLFGRARTTKDEIRTAGVNGDCTTEVEFEHEGHLYLVRRTIAGAAANVKAEVHTDRALMAEGVTDVRRYIQSILGMDDAAFRASVFAEQNHLAAFSTDVKPEQRKRLVLSLLGITPLETARDLARKDAREAKEAFEKLRSMLADLDELQAKAEQAEARAAELAAEAEAEVVVVARAREQLTAAEADIERLDDVRREYERLVQEGRSARAELERATQAVTRLEAELATLVESRARLATLEPLADGLTGAEARLAQLAAAEKARAAVEAVVLPPEPAVADESAAEAAATALDGARREVATGSGELAAAQSALGRAEALLTRAGELSGEGECPTCGQPLGEAFEQVQAHRRAEVDEASARVAELAGRVKSHKRELAAAEKTATGALAELRAAQTARTEWERVRDRRDTAEAAYQEAVTLMGGPPAEGELERVRADVKKRREASDECQRLGGKLQRHESAAAELAEELARRDDAAGRRTTLLEKVEALGFDQAAYDATRAARDEARARAERASTTAQQAALRAERARTEAAAATEKLADARAQHDRIAQLADDARHLERVAALLHAFRTNVITTIGPRLSAQAAELFGELTDHEYDHLEVDPETYEIRISDAGRSYGMSRFSGSETDLANLALRVAISEQVRFQSGGAVGLLVLDEVFGPLDDDRKERMLLALERLRARFRQVLVITHASDIKEQLPSAVEVVKLPGRRATARVLNG